MNATLFKKEIKSNWLLLVIFLAVLSVYGSMITMMFNPEMGDSLKMMADSMPDLFAAFGMADVGQTLLEFVSGYLYGMLYVAFPGVFIIILSNRLVSRYVDNGSMAYLLAVPQKRWKIMLTQCVFMLTCLVVMVVYVTCLILAFSEALFPGEMENRCLPSDQCGIIGYPCIFRRDMFLCILLQQ